jgi:hypothetical protein
VNIRRRPSLVSLEAGGLGVARRTTLVLYRTTQRLL